MAATTNNGKTAIGFMMANNFNLQDSNNQQTPGKEEETVEIELFIRGESV